MASGVNVHKDCETAYQEIKMGHKHRFVIYRLNEKLTDIVVEKTAPPTATFEEMVTDLKAAESEKQCRYVVYDAEYDLQNGQHRSKLIFFFWAPDNSTTKQKMVYAASKEKFRSTLGQGIHKMFQAQDDDDLNWNKIIKEISDASYS